jgi:hypothetical protein
MHVPSLRLSAIAIAAGIALGGCAYNPYGGLSVGVGYGSGYGGYGYNPYYDGYYGGYSPYGYGSRYGYGSYSPYFGWYDGFYYPGTGYYVYDSYRRPHRWTDRQRTYWQQRQQAYRSSGTTTHQVSDNWSDFRRERRSSDGSGVIRQRPAREQVRAPQQARQAYNVQQRTERKAERSESRQRRDEARRERQESREEKRTSQKRD